MTSEMLSGPDLGAGFLHQLSFDTEGEATTFTFHVQDGGSDAGGPPIGSPEAFGFAPARSACMFGGPRCWHRRFLLPRSEAPRVRQAYNRNRFVLETMVGQAYGNRPVDLRGGLREVLRRLGGPGPAEDPDWYVGGSAAALLLGAPVSPHDLDLGTSRAGVDRIAAALSEYLIEPVAPTDWPGVGIVRAARAFVGSFQEGVRVEWAVPLEPHEPRPFEEWSGPGVVRLETAEFEGRRVRVSRPEYALVRSAEKGGTEVMRALAGFVRDHGVDRPLLDVLLERSPMALGEREALRKELER